MADCSEVPEITVDRLKDDSDALLSGSAEDSNSNKTQLCADAKVVASGGLHDGIDGKLSPPARHQAQVKVPTQFSIRPLLTAKRKLSFEQLPKSPGASSRLCRDVTKSEVSDASLIDYPSDQGSNEHSDFGNLHSDGEPESVKRSSHIQVQSSYPSSGSKAISSAMAVSPLTKSFKAFHMHQSQSSLEMHHPYSLSSSSHSQSVLIPSLSFPCLLTPHPITQPLTLEPPPLGKVTKPPNAVMSQGSSIWSATSKYTGNSDLTVQRTGVQLRQPSSSVRVSTCSQSNTVYTTPTSSHTCCTSSTVSDLTPPSCAKSNSLTGSVARLHKQLSSGMRAMKSNVKSHQSSSTLKQVLLQPSPRQEKSETLFHCPSKIHCNNCGHKIELKTYLQKLEAQRGSNDSNSTQHRKSAMPAKSSSVSDAGSTVFDLEAVCDRGSINPSMSSSLVGERQGEQGEVFTGKNCGSNIGTLLDKDAYFNLRSITDNNSMHSKTHHTAFSNVEWCPIVSSHFPHSDELTKSFTPVFSEAESAQRQEEALTECWLKLDCLDVDELLELVEATSDLRYCSEANQIICKSKANEHEYPLREDENETDQQEESVQTVNHIVSEAVGCNISHAEDKSCVYNLKGDTSQLDKNNLDKMTSDISTISSCVRDHADSQAGGDDIKEEPSRRILRSCVRQHRLCKKRPRKKKTNGNKGTK